MPEELLAARVFEFIRDGMEAQLQDWPDLSLYQALAVTCKKLITDYPGEYIFFLANETVLFAFLNSAQVLSYHPPEALGESLVLTTVSGGLTRDPDHWRAYPNRGPEPRPDPHHLRSGSPLSGAPVNVRPVCPVRRP